MPGMIEFRSKKWHPQEFAVCMAMDAFRLCLFGKPQNFTAEEVIAWIQACLTCRVE